MNHIHHVCIQTDDYQSSLEFYTKYLDFEVIKESAGFHGRDYNSWLDLNGFMIELQTGRKEDTLIDFDHRNKGIVHFCFYTDDFDKEYKKLTELGFSNFKKKNGSDIYEVKGGRLFKMLAPEGTIIEIRDQKGL